MPLRKCRLKPVKYQLTAPSVALIKKADHDSCYGEHGEIKNPQILLVGMESHSPMVENWLAVSLKVTHRVTV